METRPNQNLRGTPGGAADVRLAGGLVLVLAVIIAGSLAPGFERPASDVEGRTETGPPSPLAGPLPVAWDEVVEVASGEAYQGPWRMNESDFRYVDAPSVDLAEDGGVAVAWVDQAAKDVFYQMYEDTGEPTLKDPTNVSRSPETFSWLPRVVVAPEDPAEVYVLWQEIVFSGGSHGGEIFFARSADGGRTFSEPTNLSNTPAGAGKGRFGPDLWHNGSLDLARGPGGDLHVAWTEYEGALWFRRSEDGGRTFSDPLPVSRGVDAEPARGPALAVGAEGRVYLAWSVEGPDRNLRVARSGDGGRSFTEPRVVPVNEVPADAPSLAVDRKGTVHLAFGESPGGLAPGNRLHYTRSSDGAETFETAREVPTFPDAGLESGGFPSLATGAPDRIYLLWEIFPERDRRPEGLALATSDDGGRTFSGPSVVPGTGGTELGFNGSLQGLLTRKLAVNDAGHLAVVNSTFRPGEASRVRLIPGTWR